MPSASRPSIIACASRAAVKMAELRIAAVQRRQPVEQIGIGTGSLTATTSRPGPVRAAPAARCQAKPTCRIERRCRLAGAERDIEPAGFRGRTRGAVLDQVLGVEVRALAVGRLLRAAPRVARREQSAQLAEMRAQAEMAVEIERAAFGAGRRQRERPASRRILDRRKAARPSPSMPPRRNMKIRRRRRSGFAGSAKASRATGSTAVLRAGASGVGACRHAHLRWNWAGEPQRSPAGDFGALDRALRRLLAAAP